MGYSRLDLMVLNRPIDSDVQSWALKSLSDIPEKYQGHADVSAWPWVRSCWQTVEVYQQPRANPAIDFKIPVFWRLPQEMAGTEGNPATSANRMYYKGLRQDAVAM